MSITSYEILTVKGDHVTADLIVWRRYRVRAPGIVEAMLDANPHLARIHRLGPFIPVGTQVRIPIDAELIAKGPKPKEIELWTANPNL